MSQGTRTPGEFWPGLYRDGRTGLVYAAVATAEGLAGAARIVILKATTAAGATSEQLLWVPLESLTEGGRFCRLDP